MVNPKIPCVFVPITPDNCCRVVDFRENDRISQYRDKLLRGEIGFFAENEGHIIGSIWATINRDKGPKLVRSYIILDSGCGLIHDIVASHAFRGQGVGAFMTSRMVNTLLEDLALKKVVIDVNVRNDASNRMMTKIGLRKEEEVVYLTVGTTRAFRFILRRYA